MDVSKGKKSGKKKIIKKIIKKKDGTTEEIIK